MRGKTDRLNVTLEGLFPFLFGGTFIEGSLAILLAAVFCQDFPSFSEGLSLRDVITDQLTQLAQDFPSFSEGLSLRVSRNFHLFFFASPISLPFRRDFH